MKRFFLLFSESAKELKNVHSLTGMAMLTALGLILNLFGSIPISQSLRLGFGFLSTAIMGMLYGPVCAGLGAGLVDVLQATIKPTGPFFPGFTLTAVLGGMLYGCFLYQNRCSFGRIAAVKSIINLVLHILLNSLWLKILYNAAFIAALPTRIFKNAAMLPIEILILWLILPLIDKAVKQRK